MFKFWFTFHIQNLWYSFTRENNFLQTPYQSVPRKQGQEKPPPSFSRHISNSFNVYLFLDSEL